MPKDLQDQPVDRFPSLATMSNTSRLSLHTAEESKDRPSAETTLSGEREYLATCQKLEQLLERKRRAEEEVVDVRSLHQELCLIGARLQREPNDSAHEDDYLAVLKKVKETLWRKIEAYELKGEFQRLHFELLNCGHELGLERTQPTPAMEENQFDATPPGDMNLSEVERQLAQLQQQIRSLHELR